MKPVDLLLLISDLEGASAQCRRIGCLEDAAILDEMKGRYYKQYFALKRSSQKT